jgi:hypothetical protein
MRLDMSSWSLDPLPVSWRTVIFQSPSVANVRSFTSVQVRVGRPSKNRLHPSQGMRLINTRPQLRRLGFRALPLLRVSLAAPAPVPAPVSALWASWAPAEACCCGAAGVVSGSFGRSSRGTAFEICRLWVPAAVVVVAVGGGSALANSSLTDTGSSSSS